MSARDYHSVYTALWVVFLIGCEKPPEKEAGQKTTDQLREQQQVDSTDKPSDVPLEKQASFIEEYKKWEARALQQFPSLGVAGSPMNLGIIKYVSDARKRSAPELEMPSYVYVYACHVAAQLESEKSAASTPVASSLQKLPAPASAPKPIAVAVKPKEPDQSALPTHWVKEYKKKDGTVVRGHWSANPGQAAERDRNRDEWMRQLYPAKK
jgi:hypothetical protein